MTVRVFPRRTNATPRDDMAFVGAPGLFPPERVNAVHISVTFTWDLPYAQQLAKEWSDLAPVVIGGPATGMRGEDFTPGRYLRPGYVITSRGCPNRCWFCAAWKRDGEVRELPVQDGWNVLDDNLLACSSGHIGRVLDMLLRQKRQPEFTGGLEAARLTPELAEALRSVRPRQMFFAYDEPSDWEPLVRAANLLWRAGFSKSSHAVRAYVLCGWTKDTMAAADARMRQVLSLGILPMAMLWRDDRGAKNPAWRHFQNVWVRPHIVASKLGAVA
jgi:hypothetical protein